MLSAAANRSAAVGRTQDQADHLYASRARVYPKAVRGPVRRIKWAMLGLCLTVYYVAPWLRWDRGPGRPDQALLIDMPGRRAFFFSIEIWPQEVYYLAGLLILGAVGLFFVTSLFGRMWCGYACPQTVWTDLFMWTERLIEGDRAIRMHRERTAWNMSTLARKVAKHTLWIVIALVTGGAWVMYFNDAPGLLRDILALQLSTNVLFFILLFTATTYLLAGWAREQVCTYMCPWPRFQSAMVDRNTLTVMYREWRGEPRGKLKKGEFWTGRGDCIDCKSCVAVCPTGIDIRDGLQLQCIGCGLCIDACNEVMKRVGRPPGLIDFSSQAMREAARSGVGDLTAVLRAVLVRPRTAVYALVLLAGSSLMLWSLLSRVDFGVSILADRSPLFVRLSDGAIRNAYTVKILNKSAEPRSFQLSVTGLPGARLAVAGQDGSDAPAEEGAELAVKPDTIGTFRVLLRAPVGSGSGEVPLAVRARPLKGDESPITNPVTFHRPES